MVEAEERPAASVGDTLGRTATPPRAPSIPAMALAIGTRALGWGLVVGAVGMGMLVALELGHAGAFARDCGVLVWLAPLFYALVGTAVGVKVGLVRGIGHILVRSATAGGMMHRCAELVLDKTEELATRSAGGKQLERVPLARIEAALKQAVLEVSGSDVSSRREPRRRLPRAERAAFQRIERLLLERARAASRDGTLVLEVLRAAALAQLGARVTSRVQRWVHGTTLGFVGVYLTTGVAAPFVVEMVLRG